MIFTEKLKSVLPKEINFDEIYNLATDDLWKTNPRTASVLALRRADIFDVNSYLEKYGDVKSSKCDAVLHYVMYGIEEGRQFIYLKNKKFITHDLEGDKTKTKNCEIIEKLKKENKILFNQLQILQKELESFINKTT